MDSAKKRARTAGVIYLLGALVAPIGLMYVPRTIIVRGDAAATAESIRASESLFRVGIASEVLSAVIFIFLLLALYNLFQGVSQRLSVAMVTLLMISIPISLLGAISNLMALILVGRPEFLSGFDAQQLDGLAYLFLRLHGEGTTVASVFWGLWLFPFGLLVIRSGFIPRILGYLLMAAGFGYLVGAFVDIVIPQYASAVGPATMILAFGELPIVFWLVIWGARVRPTSQPAS